MSVMAERKSSSRAIPGVRSAVKHLSMWVCTSTKLGDTTRPSRSTRRRPSSLSWVTAAICSPSMPIDQRSGRLGSTAFSRTMSITQISSSSICMSAIPSTPRRRYRFAASQHQPLDQFNSAEQRHRQGTDDDDRCDAEQRVEPAAGRLDQEAETGGPGPLLRGLMWETGGQDGVFRHNRAALDADRIVCIAATRRHPTVDTPLASPHLLPKPPLLPWSRPIRYRKFGRVNENGSSATYSRISKFVACRRTSPRGPMTP